MGSVPDCKQGNKEELYNQELVLEVCANIRVKSCPTSFIISISRVWMDHSNIMDEDCLSVHFRAHIVFKLSSLPSHWIPLHHCKPGQAGHLSSDTSSELTDIQYVEWGLLGGRFTHRVSLFCVWWWDVRREMLRLDEEDCQYGVTQWLRTAGPDREIFM